MLVGQALKQILAQDVRVTTFVSGRVFPGILPQNVTYPAVAYRMVEWKEEPVLENEATSPPVSHYWVISTAKGNGNNAYQTSKFIDGAIRKCLRGFAGRVSLLHFSPLVQVTIQGIFIIGGEEKYFDATDTHQAGTLYAVHHNQTDF